jgi:hypothetical protein
MVDLIQFNNGFPKSGSHFFKYNLKIAFRLRRFSPSNNQNLRLSAKSAGKNLLRNTFHLKQKGIVQSDIFESKFGKINKGVYLLPVTKDKLRAVIIFIKSP